LSIYEELQLSEKKYNFIYFAYKGECAKFFEGFLAFLKDYLKIPQGKLIVLGNKENEKTPSYSYPVYAVMTLLNDGFWHVQVKLDLKDNNQKDVTPGTQSEITILYAFRKDNDAYTIKFNETRDVFKIRGENSEDMKVFADYIIEKIKYYYERSFLDFLANTDNTREKKYGFIRHE